MSKTRAVLIKKLVDNGVDKEQAARMAEDMLSTQQRLGRAAEQGFDTETKWYHGTSTDITEFDPDKLGSRDFGFLGKGVYITPNEGIAKTYSRTAKGSSGAKVMPLYTSANKPYQITLEQKNMLSRGGPEQAERFKQWVINNGYDSAEVITPSGEILERVVYDPKMLRSPEAKFENPKSGKLLAGATGAAVLAGGQSEDAEAGILGIKGFSDEVGRLIQTGMLNPAFKNDPKKIQQAATKYNKRLKASPGFAQREDIAAINDAVTKRSIAAYEKGAKVYTPDDLANMGAVIMPVKGDPSMIGKVSQIGGVPLTEDVLGEGGFQYPLANPEGWQSMAQIAQRFINKAREVSNKNQGAPVAALYSQMGPDSTNFSSPPSAAILDMVNGYLNIDPKVIKQFDTEYRASYPSWPGIKSPDALDWLNGHNEFNTKDYSGKRRTKFTELTKKVDYRDNGFPLYSEVIDAMNHPDLAGNEIGTSGASLFFPDLNRDSWVDPTIHKSYHGVIPEDPTRQAGVMDKPRSFYQTYPDAAKEMENMLNSGGKLLPHGQKVNKVADSSLGNTPATGGFQRTTDEWVKGMKLPTAAGLTAGMLAMTPSDKVLAQGVEPQPTAGGSIADYVKNLPEVLPQMGEDFARTTLGALRGVVDPKAGVDIMTDPNRYYKPSEEGSAAYNRLNDAFGNVFGAIADQPALGKLGELLGYNKTTGDVLGQGLEAYGNLPQGVRDVTDRGMMAALAASQILPMKSKGKDDYLANAVSQKTQRGNTVGTAVKAKDYLDSIGAPEGATLDYGAGLGENAKAIGATHTFEPFPQKGFEPDFTDPATVPTKAFERVVSTNVLNVLPKDLRTEAVLNIGKSLKPGGTALVQTWDLGAIKATSKSKNVKPVKGEENAYITGTGTFQKGFAPKELQEYVQETLGDLYTVEIVPNKAKLSGVAVTITRK